MNPLVHYNVMLKIRIGMNCKGDYLMCYVEKDMVFMSHVAYLRRILIHIDNNPECGGSFSWK